MNEFKSEYGPSDHIKFVGTDIKGTVNSVTFGRGWVRYNVSWWNNGTQQTGEFYGSELEKL